MTSSSIRTRTLLCSFLALVLPGLGRALPLDAPVAPVSAAYTVHFRVRLATALPPGATLACRARLAPRLAQFDGPANQPAVLGVATISGSTATCTVQIPFSRPAERSGDRLDSASNPSTPVIDLRYEVQAVSGQTVLHTTGPQAMEVVPPPSGASAILSLNLLF